MTSHFERWCIEWGNVGKMHMALRLIGYDGPTYRAAQLNAARDQIIWGMGAMRMPGPLAE